MTAGDDAAVKNPGAGDAAPPLSELKRLGKYLIEKKIGAGGMGAVFLARDTELKRTVALKVLPRDKAANPILVRRFRAEAQAAAQLRHPNIVAVYDSGEADGYLYIAMEYVEGKDLFEMVSKRGVVPIRRSIDIIKQVAAALQHAFEQSIVHRDIKPSNLLIRRDGVVKLTDLGLARSVDDTLETNITRAGTTVGTVDYMAPEQARNSKLADIRSDLYSLGCTWYQMLTGSPPYPEGSVTNKLQAHAIKPIPDPREMNPQVPEGLTAVIRRMMAKKPGDRYQTPAELIEDLNQSKLTEAEINREIFSDLSDYEQNTDLAAIEEEGYSDDGYFESDDERQTQSTPDYVPTTTDRASRRKASRPVTTDEAEEETSPTPHRPKARTVKSETPSPEPETNRGATRAKGRAAETEEEADPDPGVKKAKPRTGKSDLNDSSSGPMHKPGADHKHSTTKPADTRHPESKLAESTKAKVPGQKAMPPKRQPISDPSTSEKSAINKDLLKYLGAAGGLVLVIVGIGWIISSYSNTVVNPFGPPPVTVNENPAVTNSPSKVIPGSTGETSPETVAASGTNPGGTRTDTPTPLSDAEKLPDWAGKDADLTGLSVFTVSPAAKSATNFATLEDALQATPASGAVIKLPGSGPFPLPFIDLKQRKRIVIMPATAQDRPVIALKPGANQTTAGLKLSDGTLDLRSLHFSIDRPALAGALRVIEVTDGQLLVQQCSFTSSGTSSDASVAMVVHSAADATSIPAIEPRLLVDRVLVRGEGLGGISIRRANLDAVVRDSLLVTGSAPAIELDGYVAAGATDVVTARPRRILRIQRCTLCAQTRIFDLAVDDAGKPPQTALFLRDSICSAQGVAQNSAIAFAGRWPQLRTTAESWLTRMTWTSTNSLYLGFEQLIDLGSSFKVVDAATWQRVWNVRADARQFQKLTFPETSLDDLSVALPQEFDSNGLSYRDVKATDGGIPGCQVNKLSVPDVTSHLRAVATTARPTLPAAARPGEPVQIKKIDLKKEDLGVALNRPDWPSGTLFEVTGAGVCQMTPARIDGKSVRIVFRQADGLPLRIQPAQPKTGDGGKSASALIAITHGTLDLTNALLEGSPNSKGYNPDWLIQANDASIILNGCRLLGSEADGSKQLGLVRWITGPPAGGEAPALVVRDSLLAGSGSGVRVECAQGVLIFRNSILAIRGDAIDLRPVRVGSGLLPILDVENVTISATAAAIRLEAAPGNDAVGSPMRLFVERSVFAPPLSFKAGEAAGATLLNCVGPVFEQKQVEWWGASNGVARQISFLIRRDGSPAAPVDDQTGLTAWRKLWDKAASIRFLTGDRGVYLAGELPIRWRDLKPLSFVLHKNSQATNWGEGGRPIGANPQAVEDATVIRKPGDATKPNSPVNQTKKNVGF